MTWGNCMTRCLKDVLSWGTLIILGGSIAGIVEAIGALIVEHGSWAAVIEAIGIAGVIKALLIVVAAVAIVVVVAALLGCILHCRRWW